MVAYKRRKTIDEWIRDNKLFLDAYHAADRDEQLKAEIHELELKYIRQHLAEIAGEDEAERIMTERGY